MLYLVKIFSEETDDNHALTMPEMIKKLAECGVNADRKTLYQDFEELRNFGWIMGINGDIKIVAPNSVVEQMKEHIERLQEQYRQ